MEINQRKKKRVASFHNVSQILPESEKIQQLYKHFFDYSPNPLCIISSDGLLRNVNSAFSRILGHQETFLCSRPFVEFVHQEDRSLALDHLKQLKDGHDVYHSEYRILCLNSVIRLLRFSFYVDKLNDLIYATAIDITEQRAAENALLDVLHEKNKNLTTLSNEFRVLLDAIPDNITFLTSDLKILWANRAAVGKFGKTAADLKGQYCYKLCCNIFSPCEHCPSIRSFITGNEESAIVKNEQGKVWNIQSFPVKNDHGDVKAIIEMARDITLRTKIESEIDKTAEYLITGDFVKLIQHVEENDVISSIKRVLEFGNLSGDVSTASSSVCDDRFLDRGAFSSIITTSKKMLTLFHYIEAIAQLQRPVLITGETGVGKEMIAQAIHNASMLQGKFIAVNVAGLDDTMFSDTLFGHKKGAFTGADKERKGLIVSASGGTLMLDEFGDLNEISQIKLLRLIENNTYYPLGSDSLEKSDVRIIVTTNRDLKKMISENKFREDLYYRLSAYYIHIPPLRERTEDIPVLLDHFLDEAAVALKKKRPSYPPELITLLVNYEFPGNVRELKSMVYDALARHRSGKLSMDVFRTFIIQKGLRPVPDASHPDFGIGFLHQSNKFPTLKEVETYLISEAMKKARGNQGIAATLLGLTRHALNKRLIKKKKSK